MFQIISDSSCDFSFEEAKQLDVHVMPIFVTLDGETYLKEGIDIKKEDYFKRLKEDKNLFPKTAQLNPQDFIEVFKPYLEAGKDIICLPISSKLSGTYSSAVMAADMLKEDFPERTIIAVDSLSVCVGQGLLLRELARMRDAGLSITKAAEMIEKVKATTKIYFTLESLEYLRRGGRVGPTTALVGGILGLRPVLHFVDGAIEQLDSVRGKEKVLHMIAEGVVSVLKGETDNVEICIGHIMCEDEASLIKSEIEKALNIEIKNPIAEIGISVGTHSGPGTIVVSYCRKYETLENGGK